MAEYQEIDPPKEKPSVREILRAMPFVFRMIIATDRKEFIILLFTTILSAPLTAFSVVSTKQFMDALIDKNGEAILFWFAWLAFAFLFLSVTMYFIERGSDILRYRAELFFQKKIMEHVSSLPFSTLEDPSFQALFTAYKQKDYIVLNVASRLGGILNNFFTLLGLFTVFVYIPWQAGLFLFFAASIRIYLLQKATVWNWNVLTMETREGRRGRYYANNLTFPQSLFSSVSLGLVKPFINKWKIITDRILAIRLRETHVTALGVMVSDIIEVIGLAVGLLVIIPQTMKGALAVSVAVVFFTSYRQFFSSIDRMTDMIRFIFDEGAFFTIAKTFFSLPHEQDVGKMLPKQPLTVQFEDVWFRYPGSSQDILQGISFSFSEGDHMALVGLNGAGKTTLLKLLMGVYEPTKGKILISGIDLKKIKPSSWRRALAVLSQYTTFFDDTLRNQVLYGDFEGKEDAKRFEVALQVSGLGNVAREFPRGMETHAGKQYAMPEDEPIELSGGQQQIVAIARTLYRHSRISIFDEPTSAVDAEKEERFFEALPEAFQSKAVIYVSHRFSTLRRAKRILVIDQGKIIEDGSHEDLVAIKGRYAELFILQAKMYQ